MQEVTQRGPLYVSILIFARRSAEIPRIELRLPCNAWESLVGGRLDSEAIGVTVRHMRYSVFKAMLKRFQDACKFCMEIWRGFGASKSRRRAAPAL